MAQENIDLGTGNNTGDGEGLRDGGVSIQSNFTELYTQFVENATTTVLSVSDLDTTYPSKIDGFRVFCPSIVVGGVVYTKTSSGWIEQSIIVVV